MSEGLILLALAGVALAFFFSSNSLALVSGDSMKPTFSDCTLVVVGRKAVPQDAVAGDIAVVDISDQGKEFDRIAHRVVENLVEEQRFSTRGDNSAYYDSPSSIDGYFGYELFNGKVDYFVNLPQTFCELKGGE